IFFTETGEDLGRMEQNLVALEANPGSKELIQTIFRAVHNLKGNAATLGLTDFARFAHAVEDVLQALRGHPGNVTGDIITLLLRALDALKEKIADLGQGSEILHPEHEGLIDELEHAFPENLPKSAEVTETELDASGTAEHKAFPGGETPTQANEAPVLRLGLDVLDQLLGLTGQLS